MAVEFRQYDEHGFPVPPAFSEINCAEDQAARKPVLSRGKRQLALAVLLVAIGAIVFGPYVVSAARGMVAQWFLSRAVQKKHLGDNRGALAELNRAVRWSPNDAICRLERGSLRLEMKAWQASGADFTVVINLLKGADDLPRKQDIENAGKEMLADAYCLRSMAFTGLQRFADAAKDADEAVKLRPSPENLNARAYARALAKIELAEALDDVNKAIDQIAIGDAVATEMLDTRGYILHLLDRNEEALKDLNQAIEVSQRERDLVANRLRLANPSNVRRMDENLAVLYHHRGLVHQKLNHLEQAQADLKRGEDLGYNPAAGVL